MKTYLLNWIHDLLRNRSHTVMLDGAKSDLLLVTSIVSQGSVLGPVLFPGCINALPSQLAFLLVIATLM